MFTPLYLHYYTYTTILTLLYLHNTYTTILTPLYLHYYTYTTILTLLYLHNTYYINTLTMSRQKC